MAAEVSFVSNCGSRLALRRPRLRRLAALSHRSPRTQMPRWLRRSDVDVRPYCVVADDGVERGEQLAHDSDDGEACGLTCIAQPPVETSQRRVMADGGQAGHEERCADFDATALDASLAAIAAAVAVHWCHAGEGCDLVAIDAAEFGQFDDQGASDDVTDAWDALEQILFGAEQRALLDQCVDGAVDPCALRLEAAQDGLERALGEFVRGFAEALLLGVDHHDELAASGEEFPQAQHKRIGHWFGRRAN